MSDIADIANDRAEVDLAGAIAAGRIGSHLPPNGYCLNCGEPVAEDHKFCDIHCRDDWQARHPNQ